jgi:hypothetical protein
VPGVSPAASLLLPSYATVNPYFDPMQFGETRGLDFLAKR